MPEVVGIRFKACGKIYDFEIEGLEVKGGDTVIVESELGLSIGNVVTGKRSVENAAKELKKVLRKAEEEDFKQKRDNEALETEARAYCLERIMARGLPMKLICAEATLDKKRIVFYFAAEGRIDFRELVKDLAAKFKTRIEMRQVGVRDEAKMLGGLGMCGRELCCRKFLTSFEPISIKMAKSQELVLNANKLSGVCGRLMCCIGYEYIEGEEEYFQGRAAAVDRSEGVTADIADETPQGSAVIERDDRKDFAGRASRHPDAPPVNAKIEEHMTEAVPGNEGGAGAGKTDASEAGADAEKGSSGGKRFRRRRKRHRRRPNK